MLQWEPLQTQLLSRRLVKAGFLASSSQALPALEHLCPWLCAWHMRLLSHTGQQSRVGVIVGEDPGPGRHTDPRESGFRQRLQWLLV